MVQVGTESLIDRAKSIKSTLMALFEEYDVVSASSDHEHCIIGTRH